MSPSELARQWNCTVSRVDQIEKQALAKFTALFLSESLECLDRDGLRLLIAHLRNALAKYPRHPAVVTERVKERAELLRQGRAWQGAGG